MQGGAPRRNNNDLVDEIMEQARSHTNPGAESGALRAFTGRAKKLTDEDDPNEVYGKAKVESDQEEEVAVRIITFWSDGFTLEPQNTLRPFTDPRSISLLSSIRSGLAPLHELGVLPGQAVEMRVVQRDQEEYGEGKQAEVWREVKEEVEKREGKKGVKAFSGAGHRLGDLPNPNTSGGTSNATSSIAGPGQTTLLGFDKAKPTTKIQFRFFNGTKHTIQFNSDQTIGDIYDTVSHLLGGGQVGVLLSGRPPVSLPADLKMTVKEAGLEGSLIIQQQS